MGLSVITTDEDMANEKLNPKKLMTLRVLKRSWKAILAVIIPIILLPIILYDSSREFRCAYIVLMMAGYWMFEPIPLAATALMPIALFPLFGVISTSEACAPYMKASNVMFIGGLLMAIAVENCNLHKRIALKVILLVGSSIKRIMFGMMLTTMFLSMWISNTATTAMMVPIVDAMLNELTDEENKSQVNSCEIQMNGNLNNNKEKNGFDKEKDPKKKYAVIRKALLLSIAYSANIGGTGTITGTGTNLVLQGFMDEWYPSSKDLTFTNWFIYAAPGMVICTGLAWVLLTVLYVRNNDDFTKENNTILIDVIRRKYNELGSITFHEYGVSFHFMLLVCLWFFRQPEFIPGWAETLTTVEIKDATPAILVALMMFLVPSDLKQFYRDGKSPRKYKTLLDWPTVQKKMPWGVVFLLGGGFALAEATQKSELSKWIGQQLSGFNKFQPRETMIFLTVIAALITEVASNVATASVLLPVVNELALVMKAHPLLLMMPVTIGISFAFMFPVATPPNAIVFESLGLKPFDMIKPGILMNFLCIGMELALINSWGLLVFDLNHFPDWAEAYANKTINMRV